MWLHEGSKQCKGILEPKAQEMCIWDLENVFFFSIGSGASSNNNKKSFPKVVRYFCKTRAVVDAVLDFYDDSNESSEAIEYVNSTTAQVAKTCFRDKRVSIFLPFYCAAAGLILIL